LKAKAKYENSHPARNPPDRFSFTVTEQTTRNQPAREMKDGPQSDVAAAGNAQIGSTVKRNFSAIGWQLVELPPGMRASAGLKFYQQLGTVAAVEPDGPSYIQFGNVTPNDPLYSSQWYLPRIAAPTAWDVTKGSSNVVVPFSTPA
jgi:hypothetical protein